MLKLFIEYGPRKVTNYTTELFYNANLWWEKEYNYSHQRKNRWLKLLQGWSEGIQLSWSNLVTVAIATSLTHHRPRNDWRVKLSGASERSRSGHEVKATIVKWTHPHFVQQWQSVLFTMHVTHSFSCTGTLCKQGDWSIELCILCICSTAMVLECSRELFFFFTFLLFAMDTIQAYQVPKIAHFIYSISNFPFDWKAVTPLNFTQTFSFDVSCISQPNFQVNWFFCISSKDYFPVKLSNYFIAKVPSNPLLIFRTLARGLSGCLLDTLYIFL